MIRLSHFVLRAALCLLLTPVLLALGTGKPLREYGRQWWQSDSGLPQNTVRAITQTRDGFLWIATEAGLVRFDGVDFAVFDTGDTPALHSDLIGSLQEDAQGTLWIGTASGLVCEHAGTFTAYDAGLASTAVLGLHLTRGGRLLALTPGGALVVDQGRATLLKGTEQLGLTEGASLVAEDAQGRVWIAGPDSVSVVESGAAQASTPTPISGIAEMQALATDAAGEVWAGGANGLAILGPGGTQQPVASGRLPSSHITSLLAAPGGGMWIGTGKGLAFALNGAIQGVPELAGQRVEALFLDRAGTLWAATGEGLARLTDGRVDLDVRKPPVNGVLSIFEDREGSMWFGADTAGLLVLRDQAFSTLTPEDGLSASLVRAVFEDHAGTMWIGTSGGGLDRLAAGQISHFEGTLPSPVVLALAETKTAAEYDLWVGTPEGLARVHDGQSKMFTTADGLSDDFVRSLYADRDGSLWIGTRNGLSHYQDGKFRTYSRLDGLPGDLVGTILRSRGGQLWVGTLGGLSRMEGERFVAVPALGGGAITALLEDHEGALWAGINERGLTRLRGEMATSFAAANLPSTIYGMLEDGSGNLWLSSRKGVDRVSIAALIAYAARGGSLPVAHYGSADGMRISEASGGGHPAAWRARDGGLWFATLNGVAVVHPQDAPRNPVPPLAAIEQVLIDDRVVPQLSGESAIRVPPGRGRLTIKYSGLSFVAPQSVRYRYLLQGFDKGWIEAGTRRSAFYTNVPPGTYKFLVRCVNSDGVWSLEPAEQRFKVEPYFYQTGWFYAAMMLALAGLGYLIYRWRVLTVEAQYRAVIEERSRIAREIHDTLAQGYVAISVQLELAERLLQSSTEAAMQQLRQTKEMVRDGLAEARSSIWNLRATSNAKALPALLAAYIASAARRYGNVIKFAVHGAYRPLPRATEEEVERIAQQAVANAIAHAHATLIAVSLNYGAEWLELNVTDDGVGMSPAMNDHAARGHFGLQGMRERAARMGGLLEIISETGRGVTIALRIRLPRAERKEAP